jgi:hypothetical protein
MANPCTRGSSASRRATAFPHFKCFGGPPYQPSGRATHREGAALFRFEAERIRDLWVLGDLVGLDALLKSNS